MGIFDLFRKKNTKVSESEDGKKFPWEDYIIIRNGKAYCQKGSHKNIGDILADVPNKWFREEFDNYFKSIKRPIEESLITSSKFFKNSVCPYCGFKLEKLSRQKARCPNCHNYIFVKTNKITNEEMLLTEEQVDKLKSERDEINTEKTVLKIYDVVESIFPDSKIFKDGKILPSELSEEKDFKSRVDTNTKEFVRKNSIKEIILENGTTLKVDYVWIEFKNIKEELKKENKEVRDFDILWDILDRREAKYIKQNNWGFLRCTRYNRFMLLNAERKFEDALRMVLEVCYYDINGCKINLNEPDYKPAHNERSQYSTDYIKKNWGLFRKPGELDNFFKKNIDLPLFDLRSGALYSGLTNEIKNLKNKLNIQWEDVKNIFIERATRVRVNLMPVPPEIAWDILCKELLKEPD